ncbi:MAG: hypothetical protein RLZZ124_1376, partial [Cyanobacteriota bacterium]
RSHRRSLGVPATVAFGLLPEGVLLMGAL